jgi:hypothetical protein
MMFNFNQSKNFLAIVGCAVAGLLSFSSAYAATESVTAEVVFVTPISISPQNQLQYGVLDEALAFGETIILNPDNSLGGSGLARILGAPPAAADLDITADAGLGITILVDNPSFGVGYSLINFLCTYDAVVDAACDVAGGVATTSSALGTAALTIGATLEGDGLAVPGNADGSFDVTVLYQ